VIKLSFSSLNLFRVDDRLKKERERLLVLKKENMELKKELEEVKTERYVEEVARDKLGMGRKGETIVVLPEIEYEEVERKRGRKLENWEKWYRVFFN